jgi:hypothetical protein
MFTVNPKQQLFERMKIKGLFWSYAPDICYDPQNDNLLCETVLKYADMDDIHRLFALYGKKEVQHVWEQTLKADTHFKRLNYFLARVFFDMNVEASDFEGLEHARVAKFRQLAD